MADETTTNETQSVADAMARAGEELPKLPGDRVGDARGLLWEIEALCNVGRAAYVDEDLDVYNMLGAIQRLLEGAQQELEALPGRLAS
jgi:hypothetical protein